METNNHQIRANAAAVWAVIVAAIFQIAATSLPALGVGEPIGSQSDEVRSLVTPAGWAFSIWGPLFAGSIAFAVYQALPAQKTSSLLARIRRSATGAFIGNGVWALQAQLFGLSAISSLIIIFTLVCLLDIYRVFANWEPMFTQGQRWFAVLPLSALAAWLTAATIVNIVASLRYHGIGAGESGPLAAALVVLTGGLLASLALARGRGNPPYAMGFLWALAGVYAAGGQRAELVAGAVLIAAALVIGGMIVGLRFGGLERWLGRSGANANSPKR